MTEQAKNVLFRAPDGTPEGLWETAYDAAQPFEDLYGCDDQQQSRLVLAFIEALTADRAKVAAQSAAPLVVADWMRGLSLQQQSVIMLATRGPDGIRKYHAAKRVHCAYRATVLRAAYRDRFLEWGEDADTFMSLGGIAHAEGWDYAVREFFDHVDELPHHYVAHLAHAAQIIGYRHPDRRFRDAWHAFYLRWCDDLHVNPETHEQMNQRLGDWGAAALRLNALGFDYPLPDDRPRVGAVAEECWDNLVNKDDRNSPEEYPAMALITYEELEGYLARAVLWAGKASS